eukprot:4352031-Amphidinium_carterae.1
MEIDSALCSYFEELFFDGYGRGSGSTPLAAMADAYPHLLRKHTQHCPRARQALQGWQRLAPGSSRKPLPWLTTLAIAGVAMHHSETAFGCLVILSFLAYLRPSEAVALKKSQIVPPPPGSGLSSVWSLVLAPFEDHVPSKVRAFDES